MFWTEIMSNHDPEKRVETLMAGSNFPHHIAMSFLTPLPATACKTRTLLFIAFFSSSSYSIFLMFLFNVVLSFFRCFHSFIYSSFLSNYLFLFFLQHFSSSFSEPQSNWNRFYSTKIQNECLLQLSELPWRFSFIPISRYSFITINKSILNYMK